MILGVEGGGGGGNEVGGSTSSRRPIDKVRNMYDIYSHGSCCAIDITMRREKNRIGAKNTDNEK